MPYLSSDHHHCLRRSTVRLPAHVGILVFNRDGKNSAYSAEARFHDETIDKQSDDLL